MRLPCRVAWYRRPTASPATGHTGYYSAVPSAVGRQPGSLGWFPSERGPTDAGRTQRASPERGWRPAHAPAGSRPVSESCSDGRFRSGAYRHRRAPLPRTKVRARGRTDFGGFRSPSPRGPSHPRIVAWRAARGDAAHRGSPVRAKRVSTRPTLPTLVVNWRRWSCTGQRPTTTNDRRSPTTGRGERD